MDNIAGSPVEGENFYAREADVERLSEILSNDDILLLGARRIGKTSIARAVMVNVRESGWRTVEINVASCQDERDFLDKMESKLRPELASPGAKAAGTISDAWDAIGSRIKSIKVSISGTGVDIGLGSGIAEDWTHIANDVLRLLMDTEHRWLIYIDELPIFLFNVIRRDPHNGVQRVRRFLDWFRNDVRALPGTRKVRWLVSGSVGLDTLVQQHGMADTINSMKHESLEAFKDDVAIGMLCKLATRYGLALTEADARKIVDAVLWAQPYYLQLAFHHVRSAIAAAGSIDMSALAAQAIEKMAQPSEDNDFHHWEGRLSIQLSTTDAAHCLALLELAAEQPNGARAETLLARLQERMPNAPQEEARRAFFVLRDILQRDAYWWPDESEGHKRYRFRLEPLRRWWLRRNSL
ncbi:MAG: hypothetical protein ACKVQK_18495 [Burkholderiales bacterium]